MANRSTGCYKLTFKDEWKDPTCYPEWAGWLDEVKNNKFLAYCKACKKSFSLSNMGATAVRSHHKGPVHLSRLKCLKTSVNISQMFLQLERGKRVTENGNNKQDEVAVVEKAEPSVPLLKTKQSTCDTFQENNSVSKAEILWALRVVVNKESFNSCKNDNLIFAKMFSDSKIAQKFSMGPDKCRYILYYGIAPHFQNNFIRMLSAAEKVVIYFDEALNKIVQRGQMDVHVRFWNDEKNEVTTRYVTSVFMNGSKADDLLLHFKNAIKDIPQQKIAQISMDGPNVNWAFYRKYKAECELCDSDDSQLIELGSCSLHVVHGSIQAAHKYVQWNVNRFLRGIYYLFKDSPTRRGLLISLSGCNLFPLKFVQTRWVENAKCVDRALEIFDNIKLFIEKAKLPDTVSAENVVCGINDPLMKAKLAFFRAISGEFEEYLVAFQSQKPMVPFLFNSLMKIVTNILKRIVKRNVIDMCSTASKLMAIDLNDSKNLLHPDKINVGLKTEKFLSKSQIKDKMKLQFKNECRNFLKKVVEKIFERSPLNYQFTRSASCFDPDIILNNKCVAEDRAQKCISYLYNKNHISDSVAEKAICQYHSLISLVTLSSVDNTENDHLIDLSLKKCFDSYTKNKVDLDTFWSKLLKDNASYPDLWVVAKVILVLSHGNAVVESGFSINKGFLVENQLEESLVKLRQVYSAIQFAGGIKYIDLESKELLKSVKMSRSRYETAKKETAKSRSEEETRLILKRKRMREIKDLKAKKSILQRDRFIEIEEIYVKINKLMKEMETQ